MAAIWYEVLRTNINMMKNVMNFSSNFKSQNNNNNNSIAQNEMDKYVINNVVNHYDHTIKESMVDDKHYSPRSRRIRTARITESNYAKTEVDHKKLEMNMMSM